MRKRWILIVLFTILLAGLTPMAAWALPPIPFTPYGTVKLNDENVPDGTEIRAFCDRVQYGYSQTYMYLGQSYYNMNVEGDDPETTEVKEGCSIGETVTFKVGTAVANQTAVWANGTQALDLTATKSIASIAIDKRLDSQETGTPPGPYLLAGTAITWTYTVTNTGETVLTDVIVIDDNGTPYETADDIQVCGPFNIAIAAEQTCSLPGIVQEGPYASVATAIGVPPDDDPPVTTSATAYYFGAILNTTLVKYTNENDANQPTGDLLEVGDNVTWTYVIANNGNVNLYEVTVVDDMGTPDNPDDDVAVCVIAVLPAGETDDDSCVLTGSAQPGQYRNLAVVTGQPPGDLTSVEDEDVSHYFGSAPAITMVKRTNQTLTESPTDLYILAGDPVDWTYELKNTGNVTLENIVVKDDNGTPGDLTDDPYAACDKTTLSPQETSVCSLTGSTAIKGDYHNIARVTAEPPVGTLAPVYAHSYYFGAEPAVIIEFKVNGVAADTSPGLFVLSGSPLNLEYVVTNTGNVLLTNLVIEEGAITVCTITTLGVGATDSCQRTVIAQTGQQSASATVTATPPGGLANVTSAMDHMYYFGTTLSLSLVKKTNGQVVTEPAGAYVLTGSTVNWTYELINNSNVTLANILVVDDNGTPGSSGDDHTVCTGITLEPGGAHTCSWSKPALEGEYTNIATAKADPPLPLSEIQATASSYYFGTSINVTFIKRTNGVDAKTGTGPLIGVGETVDWTYTIANNSNVDLQFSVIDNPAVTISCPKTTLDQTDEVICTATGTASAGQFENTATLTVTTPGDLANLSLTDTSHYYGVITGIKIEKSTNGSDADTAPGPLIKVGESVTWSYVITNTGNVDLISVSVVDNQEGAITCPATLAEGATMTCTKTSTAVEGQYSNLASVTANPPAGFTQVSASDPSHYFGSDAGVTVKKLTNGVDIDEDDPPYILVGDPVYWTYVVKNIGNLPLTEVIVTDSDASLVISCPAEILAAGTEMTCTAQGTAVAGSYTNMAYVEGNPEGFDENATNSDVSGYFGANPSITITKYTNGVDAKTPEESPYIPVGEPVEFFYEISSQETAYIFSEIEVTDDAGVLVTCPTTTLEPGDDPIICSAESTAALGQQALSGHVSARVVSLVTGKMFGTIHAEDISHYFGYLLGLDLVKLTNGQLVEEPPGPELAVGSPVTWTYAVTNTSNVALIDIVLTDLPEGIITCPFPTLGPNDSMTCQQEGIVIEGEYNNLASVSGVFGEVLVASPQAVSYYLGASKSDLRHFLPLILR